MILENQKFLRTEAGELIFKELFRIMVEDTDRAHAFECFAWTKDEALGKMRQQRPEFFGREILSIKTL